MRKVIAFTFLLLLFTGCTEKLVFENKEYNKTSSLPCEGPCPKVALKIPVAKNGAVADSINHKVFSVLKEIIFFGEKPYEATSYKTLLSSFIASYEQMKQEHPEDTFGWEGDVNGSIIYQSENIINIEIEHYIFTGGAHGYSGKRSLIFDSKTGRTIDNKELFKDVSAFSVLAEQLFRQKFGLKPTDEINSKGFMFEDDKFVLPQNIFFTAKGLLLLYNAYEIASYAEGAQELVIPYQVLNDHLAVR
jgi:hypothetical protein